MKDLTCARHQHNRLWVCSALIENQDPVSCQKIAASMAQWISPVESILFITLQLLIPHGAAVDKYDVNIAVFFNADDIYREFVFSSAEKLFRARSATTDDTFSNEIVIDIHFSKPNLTYVTSRANGLDSIIPKVVNITSTSQAIIFVDVTEDGLFFSTLLDSCSIPSIGLLQSRTAFPITQVN